MLTVTGDAARLIRSLIPIGERARSGLRIIVDPDHHSLSMSIAKGPSPADEIVVTGGSRVFLSPSAAQRLAKRTLRAAISAARSSFFLG